MWQKRPSRRPGCSSSGRVKQGNSATIWDTWFHLSGRRMFRSADSSSMSWSEQESIKETAEWQTTHSKWFIAKRMLRKSHREIRTATKTERDLTIMTKAWDTRMREIRGETLTCSLGFPLCGQWRDPRWLKTRQCSPPPCLKWEKNTKDIRSFLSNWALESPPCTETAGNSAILKI